MIQEKLQIEEQIDQNGIITQKQIQPSKEYESSIKDICNKCVQLCKRGQIKDNSPLIIEFLMKNKYLNELEPADGNLLYYISKLIDYMEFETLSGVEEITNISNSKQYFILSGHALIVTPKKGKRLTSKAIWKIMKRKEQQQETAGIESTTTNQPKKKKKQKETIIEPGDSFGETNQTKGAIVITMTELSVLSCSTEQFQTCFELLLTKKAFINNCLARILSFVSLEEIEREISSQFKELSFEANQFIFQKGEPLSHFYILRQGSCQVFNQDSVDSSLVIPSSTLSATSKTFFVKIGEIFGHEDQSRATSSCTSALTRTFFCRTLTPNTIIYAIDKNTFLNSKNPKIISQILSHSISKFRLLSALKIATNSAYPAEKKHLQCLSPPSPRLNQVKAAQKQLLPYDIPPKPFCLQDLSKQESNFLKISKTPTTSNKSFQTPKINQSVDSLAASIDALILKKKQHREEAKKNQNRSDSSDSERFSQYYSGMCSPRIHQETQDRSNNSQTTQMSLSLKNVNSKESGIILPGIKQNRQTKLSYSNSEKLLISPIISPESQTNSILILPQKRSLTPLHNEIINFNPNISNLSSNSTLPQDYSDPILEVKNIKILQKQSESQEQQNSSNILISLIKKSSLKRNELQTSIPSTSPLSPNKFQASPSSVRIDSREKAAFFDKSNLQNRTSQEKRVRFQELEKNPNHLLIVNTQIIKNTTTNFKASKNVSPFLLPEIAPPVHSILRKKEDCSPIKQFDYKSNSYRILKKLSEVTEQRLFTKKKISSTQRNIILSTMNKKC